MSRAPWADLVGASLGTRANTGVEWRRTDGTLVGIFPTRAAQLAALRAFDAALGGVLGYRTSDSQRYARDAAGAELLAQVIRAHGGRPVMGR